MSNALVYYKDDLIESNKIFEIWFETVSRMKKKIPKNSMVESLSSSLWGTLSESIVHWNSEDEMETCCCDENIEIQNTEYKRGEQYFICIDKTKGIKTLYY